MQALGPVTDAGVAVKQHFGLFPNVRITTNKAASGSATAGATASGSGTVNINKAVSFMPQMKVTSSPVAGSQSSVKGVTFKIGGRKLAQATAQGCDPSAKVRFNYFKHFSELFFKFFLYQRLCQDTCMSFKCTNSRQ